MRTFCSWLVSGKEQDSLFNNIWLLCVIVVVVFIVIWALALFFEKINLLFPAPAQLFGIQLNSVPKQVIAWIVTFFISALLQVFDVYDSIFTVTYFKKDTVGISSTASETQHPGKAKIFAAIFALRSIDVLIAILLVNIMVSRHCLLLSAVLFGRIVGQCCQYLQCRPHQKVATTGSGGGHSVSTSAGLQGDYIEV